MKGVSVEREVIKSSKLSVWDIYFEGKRGEGMSLQELRMHSIYMVADHYVMPQGMVEVPGVSEFGPFF